MSGTSAARATVSGLPLSRLSSCANSSAALLDAVGQLPEQAPALGGIHARPGAPIEGAPGGGHGALDVRGPALRDLRDAALLRGVLDGEAAAVLRRREAAVDQQAVLLGEKGPDGSERGGNRGGAGGRHGVDLAVRAGAPIMPWRGCGVKRRAAPARPRERFRAPGIARAERGPEPGGASQGLEEPGPAILPAGGPGGGRASSAGPARSRCFQCY